MRRKQLEVERVLLEAAPDSAGGELSRATISLAGRIGGTGEPTAGAGHRVENPRREPADPSPKVFPSEVARASGKLLR